jgi:Rad3-related DNA helicase
MNKVLQAAGRVIRTTEDRGVVALLDDRFTQREYKSLFPREWEQAQCVSRDACQRAAAEFWG